MKEEIEKYLRELKEYGIKNDIPNVTEFVGKFLNMLIKIRSPKSILEIGCANGYSTIWMAEAARSSGSIIHAIDHSEPTFNEAKNNLSETGYDDIVKFYFGNALDVISLLPSDLLFDFVFIDAQKAKYLEFWNAIQSRLSDESIVVFDDMLSFPDKTKSLSDALKDTDGFDQIMIPDGDDGILLLIKN